jgi:hypothetical protein
MRENTTIKVREWFLFFPSTNISDIAAHYRISAVKAPNKVTALTLISQAKVDKENYLFFRLVLTSDDLGWDWDTTWGLKNLQTQTFQVDRIWQTDNSDNYRVSDSHFLLSEITPQLRGELLKIKLNKSYERVG